LDGAFDLGARVSGQTSVVRDLRTKPLLSSVATIPDYGLYSAVRAITHTSFAKSDLKTVAAGGSRFMKIGDVLTKDRS
jgi:hypothetical protein